MANILGYAERGEGGGAFDIGGALTGAAQKIQQANIAEDQRRQELTDKYDAAKRKVESYESGKSKGFNNWMQEQITKVKDQMYTDFQALKKSRGRNDSAYRRKMSNIDSSWSMLAKRAKDWNTHYEKGLQQVSSGEGSDYMAFLLGEDSKIGDFGNLDMNIDEDGNMSLQGIDPNTGAIFNRSLTSIMAPENSFDESLNTSDALIEMTQALPETKLWDEKTKQYVEDPKLSPAFNEQRLRNVEANTSNPRAIAKWYSGLYDHQVSFVTSVDQRIQKANDYLASDIGRMSVKQRADELHQAAKTAGKAGYTMAQAQADAEMQILGEQQMLMVSSAEDKNNISNPQFQGHSFTIPPPSKGGRPMTITYNKINPDTGDVEEVTKTFQPGDEVNIGDMQHSRVRAGIYEGQSTMSGRIESGKKTKTPRPPKPGEGYKQQQVEDADKLFYENVSDAAQGNMEGYIKASNGRFSKVQTSHNGKEGAEYREYYLIAGKPNKEGKAPVDKIEYPIVRNPDGTPKLDSSGEPIKDIAAMEKLLANKLQGGKPLSGQARFDAGKKVYDPSGKKPYQATPGTPEARPRYKKVSSTATSIKGNFTDKSSSPYERFTTKNKEGETRSMNSDEAMNKIMTQDVANNPIDIKRYMQGFGNIPTSALKVKYDDPWGAASDTGTIELKSPYTKGKHLNVKFEIAGNSKDENHIKANKKMMELAFEFYHTRKDSRREEIKKEMVKNAPCINGKKMGLLGTKVDCK